jgi:hypothetical protein
MRSLAPFCVANHIPTLGGDPLRISLESAPSLGDVRAAGEGATLVLVHGVTRRKDWGRYQDAIAQAIGRGAEVRWVR